MPKRITRAGIEEIIDNKFKQTLECKFKRAWIPKGFACVERKEFKKELAKEVYNHVSRR